MQEHIKVGKQYPDIDLNTSYSFGLDDQEFVVAFEGDDPARFLDLVQRLRTTEASRYTKRDTPTFTCVAASVERALERARRDLAGRDGRRLGCPPCSARSPRASCALALALAGCGGDDDGGGSESGSAENPVAQVPSGLQEQVRAAQDPQQSDFPATEGRTLQDARGRHRRRPRDGPGRLRLPRGRGQPHRLRRDRRHGRLRLRQDRAVLREVADVAREGPVPGARRRARHRPAVPLGAGGHRGRPVRRRLRRATSSCPSSPARTR